MLESNSPESIDRERRRFLRDAAIVFAAAELAAVATVRAQPPSKSGTNRPFGPVKQIDAQLLNVGYVEVGPANGQPVILLHGWPYDIHSFVDVAPILAAAGYRTIVPYLRGYGTTRFLSPKTMRNGQQSVVALDVIALMDALKIDKAIIGGFDWGARTADIMAILWPQRCKAIVPVSGYLVTSIAANEQPLPPMAEYGWWYQYYFATHRGELGYAKYRRDFNELIWKIVSPKQPFDDAAYARTAAAFDNPDHVAIVIHNYRWRLGLAQGEPRYDELEQKLFALPAISVPAITLASDFDGPNASGTAYRNKFTGRYEHRVLPGIGHDVPREAPEAFAKAIVDVDHKDAGTQPARLP
jgi:pimeloyl-ACP methyl ester carboxylesterase